MSSYIQKMQEWGSSRVPVTEGRSAPVGGRSLERTGFKTAAERQDERPPTRRGGGALPAITPLDSTGIKGPEVETSRFAGRFYLPRNS